MHISEGNLRAFLDHQLSESQMAQLQSHLDECSLCQNNLKKLEEHVLLVVSRLDKLPEPIQVISPTAARLRLESIIEKENKSVFNKMFASRSRLAAGALVLVLLAAVLAVPQVRAIATGFLGLFRVEQVAVVPVGPDIFEGKESLIGPQFHQMLSSDVKMTSEGTQYTPADVTEAASLVDFPLRLPAGKDNPDQILIEPGMKMEYTVDLPRLKAILDQLGQDSSFLPQSLDRAVISGEVPTAVVLTYGQCQSESFDPDVPRNQNPRDCNTLLQLPSPSISAPPGLDVDPIAQAYLRAAGMSEREAKRFSESVDWATTLVIPIPSNATSRDIQVDGVKGVLVESRYRDYLIIWVKDGIMYVLAGAGNSTEGLQIANSLESR